jgi:outer membrane translocation and assembly module TamA
LQLLANKNYVLPGPIGIIGFTDVGKVWMKNQTSKKWHNSYGGGLYFAPFNTILISATVAKGEEETLFNISLGTRFNLMF